MQSMRRPQRLAQATITVLVVFGLAVARPMPAGADEKLGETAIDAAYDQLSPEEPTEEEAPPPAEETQPAPEPEASGSTEPAPTGDAGTDATTASTAATEETVPAADTAAATDSGGSGEIASAQQATAEQPAAGAGGNSDGNDRSASSTAQGVAENAISNVLSGGPALTVDPALPALESAAPISGGTAAGSGSGSGDNGLREETSEQAADLRAAGNSLRPSTVGAAGNRSDGEPREGDGGTVVVNGLEDSGDEGKVAVHGNIVAGTLCDGSQFWSLDGGGTINANGVNLSANGGTAVTDASGGDDNRGGAAGNGGSAGASADGGIVVVDSLVTGNNTGNQVSVGDQTFNGDCGQGVIDGGDATTINNVNISADGGTAVADASGGDDNVAGNGGSAGNGGTARASADGGIVIVGDLILGNNEGNEVNVGSGGSGSSGGCLVDGGSATTIANIDISADGGLAGADASGGDDNAAFGEDAAAGNGGRARADADGGLILAGDIIAGNNQGNTINGQCGGAGGGSGSTFVYGGDVINQTTLSLNADGGAAFADAAGGDDNVAAGGRGDDVAAGNGGRARADASGGVIQVGDIVTGNNVGNVIAFGASNLAAVPERDDEKKPRLRTIKPTFAAPSKQDGRAAPKQGVRSQPAGRNARSVGKLPNTGSGPELVAGSHTAASFVFAGIALFGIAALAQAAPGRRQPLAAAPERASRTVLRDERPR